MMQIGAIVVDLIVAADAKGSEEIHQPRYQRVIDHVLYEAINGENLAEPRQ